MDLPQSLSRARYQARRRPYIGAAASPELIDRMEKALKADVYSGYGLTETAPLLTSARAKPGLEYKDDADRHRRRSMAGWPVPGVQVRVVDSNMKDVPRDMESVGEVVASGE